VQSAIKSAGTLYIPRDLIDEVYATIIEAVLIVSGRHRAGLIFSRVRTDARQKVPLACKANRYWFLAKLGQHSRCQHYQHSQHS
jgi:hypothetical protein